MSRRLKRTRARPSEAITTPAQHDVVTAGRAFGRVAERTLPIVRQMAGELSEGIEAFEDDLVQEAYIRLWELDPSRYGPEDERYLLEAMRTRMRAAAERERQSSLIGDPADPDLVEQLLP